MTTEHQYYYDLFAEIDDFEKAFINNEFCFAVAEIIIFSHKQMREKAAASYEKAIELSKPSIVSRYKVY